jgi:hypothetical protein
MVRAAKERGGSALGIESEGPLTGEPLNPSHTEAILTHLVVLLTFGWSLASDDEVMNAFADRWLEQSKNAAKKLSLLHPWVYINYAKENQNPFTGYGEKNRKRLESVQRSVDPTGVFTSRGLVPGFFKIH